MRKGRRCGIGCILGIAAISIGVLIIMAMLLPAGFWWFVIASGMIAVGIYLIRSC